jgi:hypothetical protein
MVTDKKKRCDHTGEVCSGQKRFIQEEIKAHKWILSLHAGRDVGSTVAELDYFENRIKQTGQLFRTYFCHHICTEREDCGVERFAAGVEDHLYEKLKIREITPEIQLILDHIGITPQEYIDSYHKYLQQKSNE